MAGNVSGMADAMSVRNDKIDSAVARTGELLGFLQDEGPLTPGQARLLVLAAVRAVVPNALPHEIRQSAFRIAGEAKTK